MTVLRSPNYPAISLSDAIARVDLIFKKEHKHPTDRDVIASDIGYGSFNGASSAIISALHKYELLEPVGSKGQYKVSDNAIDILLHSPGASERITAIKKVAFAPPLFSELHSHYGDSLPSDQNIRTYLLKKDFNPKTVAGVIRAYRDTIEFVNVEIQNSTTEFLDELQETPMQTQATKQTSSINDGRNNNTSFPTVVEKDLGESVVGFKLTGDCGARVEFIGQVTQEAIEKLIKHLELSKDAYPMKSSIEQKTAYHESEE